MERRDSHEAYRRIIDDTLRALAPARRQTTNLYVDTVPYEKGDTIGPEFQGIRARRRSLLVFADESPRANFGHDCRYRLYDAESQKFYEQARVRFPPFRNRTLDTLELVHAPVPLVAPIPMPPPLPVAQALTGPPASERPGVLLSHAYRGVRLPAREDLRGVFQHDDVSVAKKVRDELARRELRRGCREQ